jgi:DNA-binding transcriptional ArsR family regulator
MSLLPINVDDLRLHSPQTKKASRITGGFLKGPIPLKWLSIACDLGGKTLATALAIRYMQGLKKTAPIKVTTETLTRFFCVDRSAKARALKALESAGLITIERKQGKKPIITILEVPGTYCDAESPSLPSVASESSLPKIATLRAS